MKKLVSVLAMVVLLLGTSTAALAMQMECWFPPGWKSKAQKAKAITDELTRGSGVTVKPRIARSYPEILGAFSKGDPCLVYVGSFVQAIINARGLGEPLVQNVNGKDLYSGVLVYPKGEDPEAILATDPARIAFAAGASSGESSAKAATGGKASIKTPNHAATCGAVKSGKAKAGVVKNWWWESNHGRYPDLSMYRIPDISIEKNPDNVLTASNAVPPGVRKKIRDAAIAGKDAFGAPKMAPFDKSRLQFPLSLMKKGKIDPQTYSW